VAATKDKFDCKSARLNRMAAATEANSTAKSARYKPRKRRRRDGSATTESKGKTCTAGSCCGTQGNGVQRAPFACSGQDGDR
jgi:hypothetical protein